MASLAPSPHFTFFLCLALLASAHALKPLQEVFEQLNLLTVHPEDEEAEKFLVSNTLVYTVSRSALSGEQVRIERRSGDSGDTLFQKVTVVEVSPEMMKQHYGKKLRSVCLKKGTPADYIEDYFQGTTDSLRAPKLRRWFTEKCAKVEFGLISFVDETLEVFWVNHNNNNQEISVGELRTGEPNTMWRQGYIGHVFTVKPTVESSSFKPFSFVLENDQILRIGEQIPILGKRSDPYRSEYDRYHKNEIARASRIKKVFTTTGYKRMPVPRELWGSIRTFWNNNRDNKHTFAELWEGKGIFVNWWKAEPRMSVVPFGLKREWHDLFQPTLEAWSNTTLERTDIYGIRVYYRNAELIDHVDRHETHAVSAIINVEQKGMNSDWELEIYDVNGNIIHSDLQRGEAMLYESAKCMHGRPKGLDGEWYANVFFHYRPDGNPDWWKEESSPVREEL